MIVLGLHGGVTINQHEPAAALVIDGRLVALCEEERYLRVRTCYGVLPHRSIKGCLRIAGLRFDEIDLIVTPGITYDECAARWRDYLRHIFGTCPRIEQVHHQEAHLASAYYTSGLDEALCVSLDHSGDGSSGMIGYADKRAGIKILEDMPSKRSLGFFYTLMTYYLGFEDGEEYKVMSLAPYGKPTIDLSQILTRGENGWDFDWSYVRSNPSPKSPFEPLYSNKVTAMLGQPNRRPDEPLNEFYHNVACSTQHAMEECVVSLMQGMRLRRQTRNLCLAGGMALNTSVSARILQMNIFDNVFVPPFAGDRGLAAGCGYLGACMLGDRPEPIHDAYLGEGYSDEAIQQKLDEMGCHYEETEDPAAAGAEFLTQNRLLGWYQGRSEACGWGLGNRSILSSCTDLRIRDAMTNRIKHRDGFLPYSPSVLQESAASWFQVGGTQEYPYMTMCLQAVKDRAGKIPAVIHADGRARIQTVSDDSNPLYSQLISTYARESGIPVLLNASFNLRGQPLVETPSDAIMTFYGSGLDALILGNFVVQK